MPVKVLMVCLGNICRSPLAEGILKNKVSPELVAVDSAGTAGYHVGKPPDPRSVAVAAKYGLDISGQRCRQFSPDDFDEFDLIYVMDRDNLADVAGMANNERNLNKIRLLLEAIDGVQQEVPDPYYGGSQGFVKVFELIDEACTGIAMQIEKEYGKEEK